MVSSAAVSVSIPMIVEVAELEELVGSTIVVVSVIIFAVPDAVATVGGDDLCEE